MKWYHKSIHCLIAAVTILVPLLEMLDIMPHEETQNLLLNMLPMLLCGGGFSGLAPQTWFYYSLSMAVGATYLKAAIEDDDAAAKTLVFTRLTLGVLNMVIASRTHCVNYIFGAYEIATALLFIKTLELPSKKKQR
jgi:hypothetical protein